MCSAPGHEFWDYCLRVVVERSALANAFPHAKRWDSIERIAGPAMLYVALMDWRYITGEHLPIIDDAALIYPYGDSTPTAPLPHIRPPTHSKVCAARILA